MKELVCISYILFFIVYTLNIISIQLAPTEISNHYNVSYLRTTTPHLTLPKTVYFSSAIHYSKQ